MVPEELTEKIIGAYYAVYRGLGFGFLESVYQNAMAHELKLAGLQVLREFPVKVHYKGVCVGDFRADLIVNDLVIIELKAANGLDRVHEAQLLNYLRATQYQVGLLFNFGPKYQFRRFAYGNDRKTLLASESGPQKNAE